MPSTHRALLTLALALSLSVGLSAALHARPDSPEERLAALIRSSSASPVPALAFLRGVGELGAFELDGAGVERALAAAEIPADSAIRALLHGTTRLAFDGSRGRMDRDAPATFAMDGGAIELDRRVRFRLRGGGARIELSDIDGVKVGESADSLYDLRKAVFLEEGGRPIARVTAGAFIFSKTVTIDLSPPPEEAVTADADPAESDDEAATVASPGLTGALGEATGGN